MGKKTDVNVDTAAEAVKFVLTAEQKKLVDAYIISIGDEDDVKEFLKMTVEAQLAEAEWAKVNISNVVQAKDVVLSSIMEERGDLTFIGAGGRLCRPGTVIEGTLRGTQYIHSRTFKEYWDEKLDSAGVPFWTNKGYLITLASGSDVLLWQSPGLTMLQKVLTQSAAPSIAGLKDPYVVIKYHTLLKGREEVLRVTGTKLTKGTDMHHFDVKIEEGAKTFPFRKECLNQLNSPVLNGKQTGEFDRDAANLAMYNQLSGQAATAIGFDDFVAPEGTVNAEATVLN